MRTSRCSLLTEILAMRIFEKFGERPGASGQADSVQEFKGILRNVLRSPDGIDRDSTQSDRAPKSISKKAIDMCDQVFRTCQKVAAEVAQQLCPGGILQRHGVRKAVDDLTAERKKAYVTLETTPATVSGCLRALRDASSSEADAPDEGSLIGVALSPR